MVEGGINEMNSMSVVDGGDQITKSTDKGKKRKKRKEKKGKKDMNKLERTKATDTAASSQANTERNVSKEKKKRRKAAKTSDSDTTTGQGGKEDGGDSEAKLPKQKKKKMMKKSSTYKEKERKKSDKVENEGISQAHEPVAVENMKGLEPIAVGISPMLVFTKEPILSHVTSLGFTSATPIQRYCWPALRAGRDVVGVAETGSGKTLAFALPGVEYLMRQKTKGGIRMLVIAPTRELALQTAEVASSAIKSCRLACTCVYGGVPKGPQRRQARTADALIATPGRLKDLVADGSISLNSVEYLVLDEADRLLDLGFEPDVRWIIEKTSQTNRQTAMVSATWPQAVRSLASEFLSDPVLLRVGGGENGEGLSFHAEEGMLQANKRVELNVEVMEIRDKGPRLLNILKSLEKGKRCLVFALYKKEAARLESTLQYQGFNCCSIHGDKSQREREDALSQFRKNITPLMIATDVAARGLDIPDVETVINHTFPLTIEDFVHRVGRTGRAGKAGRSFTFFTSNDKVRAGELVQVLLAAKQHVPEALTKFGTHIKKKEHKLYGSIGTQSAIGKVATKVVFDDSDSE